MAAAYERFLHARPMYTAAMTVAEIHEEALTRGWGVARMHQVDQLLSRVHIHPHGETTAEVWARVRAHGSRIGRPVGHGDAWIAATALELGFPLLTNNRRHYEDIPHLPLLPTPSG